MAGAQIRAAGLPPARHVRALRARLWVQAARSVRAAHGGGVPLAGRARRRAVHSRSLGGPQVRRELAAAAEERVRSGEARARREGRMRARGDGGGDGGGARRGGAPDPEVLFRCAAAQALRACVVTNACGTAPLAQARAAGCVPPLRGDRGCVGGGGAQAAPRACTSRERVHGVLLLQRRVRTAARPSRTRSTWRGARMRARTPCTRASPPRARPPPRRA